MAGVRMVKMPGFVLSDHIALREGAAPEDQSHDRSDDHSVLAQHSVMIIATIIGFGFAAALDPLFNLFS